MEPCLGSCLAVSSLLCQSGPGVASLSERGPLVGSRPGLCGERGRVASGAAGEESCFPRLSVTDSGGFAPGFWLARAQDQAAVYSPLVLAQASLYCRITFERCEKAH